jgi:hypothetical protein
MPSSYNDEWEDAWRAHYAGAAKPKGKTVYTRGGQTFDGPKITPFGRDPKTAAASVAQIKMGMPGPPPRAIPLGRAKDFPGGRAGRKAEKAFRQLDARAAKGPRVHRIMRGLGRLGTNIVKDTVGSATRGATRVSGWRPKSRVGKRIGKAGMGRASEASTWADRKLAVSTNTGRAFRKESRALAGGWRGGRLARAANKTGFKSTYSKILTRPMRHAGILGSLAIGFGVAAGINRAIFKEGPKLFNEDLQVAGLDGMFNTMANEQIKRSMSAHPKNLGATGNMVFGMYNTRHGGQPSMLGG